MGELARQPGCPQVATTPLELLTPRPGETTSFKRLQRNGWILFGAGVGLTASLVYNRGYKRPLWAGVHRHILLTVGIGYVGKIIADVKHAAAAENDEVYKHYISLHPEDFPPFERKRYADVYLPFKPIR